MSFETWEELVAYFEAHGGILWDIGREGAAGWAICPCCGKRDLRIELEGGE